MPEFILMTRLSPEALRSPANAEAHEERALERIARACPGVEWKHSYAMLGQYDFLDIFSAPDLQTAMRVSALMRTLGRSHSEVWPAIPRKDFHTIIAAMS
ncbi:GYD domain-containing protein [Paraburkholderia oxyphila]|uniref:GYD domain-containing protein n=1 Tax=Paraburkholderia oxyphila TaxID=614212 RepID=UPI000482AFBB|nr:GYD domain-containing protein [Paraburkholderia oxyphila]